MKPLYRIFLSWFQRPVGWWVLFLLWMGIVTLATCVPGRNLPQTPFLNFDKAVHFIAFFIAAGLLFPAIRLSTRWGLLPTGWVALGIVWVLGILDEYKQLCVPGRKGGDWADIAANSLGAAVAVIMLGLIYGYTIGRSKNANRLAARRD